jgi:Asp-tRNA(Asn)/Glu-tRNA(Gln) amidotransferase A subunit family amidase
LKPTPGRFPLTGHFPPAGGAFTWIGVVGPMARTAADLRALFEAMAGSDPGDPCAAPVLVRWPKNEEVQGLRIGLLESDALGTGTPETQDALRRAAKALSEQGLVVEPMPLKGLERAIELWWAFFGQVVSYLLGGMVAGRETELSPMLREYIRTTADEPPLTLDRFLNASVERDVCRTEILRQMDRVHLLLSPVSTGPAFRHGEGNWRLSGGAGAYRETMRYSQWLNLTGFPGAVVPVGTSPDGLPIGVQIIGQPYEDELIRSRRAHRAILRGLARTPRAVGAQSFRTERRSPSPQRRREYSA